MFLERKAGKIHKASLMQLLVLLLLINHINIWTEPSEDNKKNNLKFGFFYHGIVCHSLAKIIITAFGSPFNFFQRCTTKVLIFSWLLPLLIQIDAALFEENMINYSEDNKKTVPTKIDSMSPHKQTLLWNIYIEENYLTFSLKQFICSSINCADGVLTSIFPLYFSLSDSRWSFHLFNTMMKISGFNMNPVGHQHLTCKRLPQLSNDNFWKCSLWGTI